MSFSFLCLVGGGWWKMIEPFVYKNKGFYRLVKGSSWHGGCVGAWIDGLASGYGGRVRF